jgi:hypothetical protein
MGLIDFKFLILLCLAIVIYFLYKELDLHRKRLTFCEEKIKELEHLPDNSINNTQLFNNLSNNFIQNSNSLNDENKNLSILLPIKTLNQTVKHITETSMEESSSLEISENKNLNLKNNSESKIESDTKHLEIYSNDNDNNLETTISDSLMISKTENLTASLKITNNTEISESEQKIVISDSEQKIVSSNNEINDLNILSKMKLIELQNIAKNKNLCLDKKVNGHQKKKTKLELIDELSKI